MNSKGDYRYEGYGNCPAHRRPRSRRHPQGDQKDPAYPRGRPVTDNIEKMAKILLRHVGLAQQNGLEIVHIDEGIIISGVNPQRV